MAIIVMAVYDTEDNKRTDYTRRTLKSLMETVDFKKHRLFISDNGSCDETRRLYTYFADSWRQNNLPDEHFFMCLNGENLGTAEAVNKGIHVRIPGEHVIKIDNDVEIHYNGWVDEMEAFVEREPNLGQVGLKRKDLGQSPVSPNYPTQLIMLPHEKGQRWLVAEMCHDIFGTCVLHSSKLLDKIGYMYQPRLYGFDDVLTSIRSKCGGFINCFIPYIEIDHIDVGGDDFTKWKQDHSGEQWAEVRRLSTGYQNGTIPIFYSPYENNRP